MTSQDLVRKVEGFMRRSSLVSKTLRDLGAGGGRVYVFGGTIREILLKSRVENIRDIDVVVSDEGFDLFKKHFRSETIGINSFGGLRLVVNGVAVDAWPLSSTWAFREGHVENRWRHKLPETTFLNIDSVIYEITRGNKRKTRVIAEPFLQAIRDNVLDIVLADNPFPALAAVRAIRLHVRYQIPLSHRLAVYILNYLDGDGFEKCIAEQMRHFHKTILDYESLALFHKDLKGFISYSKVGTYTSWNQASLFERNGYQTECLFNGLFEQSEPARVNEEDILFLYNSRQLHLPFRHSK